MPVAPPPTMLMIIPIPLLVIFDDRIPRLLKKSRLYTGCDTGQPACGTQAARTVLRNFSTSLLRLRLSCESDRADDSTCAEAEPVELAPLLTWVIFSATSAVPLAASLTLRAISAV